MPIRPVGNKRDVHWARTKVAAPERREETVEVWDFQAADGTDVTDAKVSYYVDTDPGAEELISGLRIIATYTGGMMGTGPRLSPEDAARLKATIKQQLEDEAGGAGGAGGGAWTVIQ
jgi:hypothetical protein